MIDGVFIDVLIDGSWVTFGSVNVHPTCGSLDPLISVLANAAHFVVGGDFNARDPSFGDVSGNAVGGLLRKWNDADCCRVLNPPTPTCFRSPDGSYIDMFLLDGDPIFAYTGVDVLPSFSDHSGIGFALDCPAHDLVVRNGITLRQYGGTNVARMNGFIEREFDALRVPMDSNLLACDLEVVAERTGDIFAHAIERYVPSTLVHLNGVLLSATPALC